MVSADFCKLFDQARMVNWEASQARKGFNCLFVSTLPDVVARCFGKHEHPTDEDQRPDELESNRNSITTGVLSSASSIVYDSGKEEADCDSELIASDDRSPNPFGSRFRLV